MPDTRIPPIVYPVLLIACFCIYGIILDPGVTFAGMDFLNLNYPRVYLSRDAIAHGALPLWNWHEWGGAPLMAALQGAIFYPLTWLAWLIPLPYGLQAFVFLHMYLAGLGASFLARKCFHLSLPGTIGCGVLYMGSDFFPGRLEQFQIIAVNCLLPWLMLVTYKSWENPVWKWLLSLVWALTILAGHPQYAVFNLLASLALLLGHGKNLILNWKSGVRVATSLILGTCLSAVQLLPTWELSQLSERIWPYANPTFPQLEWKHLPALFVPHYHQLLTGQSGRVFGSTELGLYCGILALPLAITGMITAWRSRSTAKKLILISGAVWLTAMIFALGTNGFIATIVFDYLPFFNKMRGAARSLNIASLMLTLLAGAGLSTMFKFLEKFAPSRWIQPAVLIIILADLVLHHFSPLHSIMIRRDILNTKPLISSHSIRQQSPAGRIYRFTASDSDLYIDNSASAVAERIIRFQPNITSIMGLDIVDGYEEGLLPTRSVGNLMRRFNRNLRSDSPDSALLAFMGSNVMFTEFPIPGPVSGWTSISPGFPRPEIVPRVMDNQTIYSYWKSDYNLTSLVLNSEILMSEDQYARFQKQINRSFPTSNRTKISTHSDFIQHPLTQITADKFNKSIMPADKVHKTWNHLVVVPGSPAGSLLVLIHPYPGWKIDQKNSSAWQLKSLCSLFCDLQCTPADRTGKPVKLIFAPFSFKIGLFLSLLSVLVLSQIIIPLSAVTKQQFQIRDKSDGFQQR